MATSAPATPKVSILKRIGHVIGKILGVVAVAAPEVDMAAKVAEAMLPQFSAAFQAADNLFSKIAKQAIATEAVYAAAGNATGTGAQKLADVVKAVSADLDQWVANQFPGAAAISEAKKSALVSAIVDVVNEIDSAPVVA